MRAIHNSKDPALVFKNVSEQREWTKPNGLWYGLDDAWLEWCRMEEPEWIKPFNYELDIDYLEMLTINNEAQLLDFTRKFRSEKMLVLLGMDGDENAMYINWRKVAKEYCGIEIAPYIGSCRMTVNWYYEWDCASGCIWHKDALNGIRPLKRPGAGGQL